MPTRTEELETEGTRDPEWPIRLAQRFLDAGACMIMIESEGITENVKQWRHRCTGPHHQHARPGDGDVRGDRSGGFRLVHQELGSRSEPLRGSQSDRPVGMPAFGYLGNREPLGTCGDLQRIRTTTAARSRQLGETMTPVAVPDLRGHIFRSKRLMPDAEAREYLSKGGGKSILA